MLACEPAVGVQVDGEPLAGVEQLDENGGIRPEGGDVICTEETHGLFPHRVDQEAAVGKRRQAERR